MRLDHVHPIGERICADGIGWPLDSHALAQFADYQDAGEKASCGDPGEKCSDTRVRPFFPRFREHIGVEEISRDLDQRSTVLPVSRSRSTANSSNFGPPSKCALKSGAFASSAR